MASILGSAVGSLIGGIIVSYILWKLLFFINEKVRSYIALTFPYMILIVWWLGSSNNVASGNT